MNRTPFMAQCGEVARRGYERPGYDKKRHCPKTIVVKPLICEEQIWFEPSLKDGVFVGRCKNESHNPVYRTSRP